MATTVIIALITLLIGFLLGWLIEWRIDLAYWRSYFKEAEEEAAAEKATVVLPPAPVSEAAPAQLPPAAEELIITTLREQIAQRDADLGTLRATIEQLSASEARWRAREAELLDEARRLRAELDALAEAKNDVDAEWRHELLRREQQWQESKDEALARLRAENQALQAQFADARAGVENEWRAELARREQHWQGELGASRAELEALRAQLAEVEARFKRYKLNHPTSLADIEGIGPKLEDELRRAGIYSFDDLARRTPDDLQTLLNPPKWRKLDFEGWIAQAKHLAQEEVGG
jgi:predicted flap endonuclease-1-like 5' DNA nuclease